MMIQLTVEVSRALAELMTKLTPGVIDPLGAESVPTMPPGVLVVRKMMLFAVTAEVKMVVVPNAIASDTPTDAAPAPPAAMRILFPGVVKTRLPFNVTRLPAVAVIFPVVATTPVDAVTTPAIYAADCALPIRVTALSPPTPAFPMRMFVLSAAVYADPALEPITILVDPAVRFCKTWSPTQVLKLPPSSAASALSPIAILRLSADVVDSALAPMATFPRLQWRREAHRLQRQHW